MFNVISTFVVYSMPKTCLLKSSSCTIQSIVWSDKVLHIFLEGICLKVNVIARLDLEITYYNVTVKHVSCYNKTTPPNLSIKLYKIGWLEIIHLFANEGLKIKRAMDQWKYTDCIQTFKNWIDFRHQISHDMLLNKYTKILILSSFLLSFFLPHYWNLPVSTIVTGSLV